MKANIFNICLLAGWLMIVAGLALVSPALALGIGGLILMAVTLLLARWAGVQPHRKADDVS